MSTNPPPKASAKQACARKSGTVRRHMPTANRLAIRPELPPAVCMSGDSRTTRRTSSTAGRPSSAAANNARQPQSSRTLAPISAAISQPMGTAICSSPTIRPRTRGGASSATSAPVDGNTRPLQPIVNVRTSARATTPPTMTCRPEKMAAPTVPARSMSRRPKRSASVLSATTMMPPRANVRPVRAPTSALESANSARIEGSAIDQSANSTCTVMYANRQTSHNRRG